MEIERTKGRRKIDIVIYKNDLAVGFIETESDLNDLKLEGVTRRSGHYDVLSLACAANGTHFSSYKSLERMAAAAYYFYLRVESNDVLNWEAATKSIEAIRSDDPETHNPSHLSIFLVTGYCRQQHREILAPRLLSLNADLISVTSQ